MENLGVCRLVLQVLVVVGRRVQTDTTTMDQSSDPFADINSFLLEA